MSPGPEKIKNTGWFGSQRGAFKGTDNLIYSLDTVGYNPSFCRFEMKATLGTRDSNYTFLRGD